MTRVHTARLSVVDVAFERSGSAGGWPVVLLHGFPYDVRCFDDVARQLATEGADVVVPYLRGFGATRFHSPDTMRSGQQAALAHDLLELVDALGLDAPIVGGFDWGGRAACVASLLWPERIAGLVTVSGYNVHNVAKMAITPDPPAAESHLWYQWYFHSDRGRAGLDRYRRDLARQLWFEWSPGWVVPDGVFEATARSFDNPDFVPTVIHSYRHRYGLTAGDPAYEHSELIVASSPRIAVPTVVLDPTVDPVLPPRSEQEHATHFSEMIGYERVSTGHNPPQEDPASFVRAVLTLHASRTR